MGRALARTSGAIALSTPDEISVGEILEQNIQPHWVHLMHDSHAKYLLVLAQLRAIQRQKSARSPHIQDVVLLPRVALTARLNSRLIHDQRISAGHSMLTVINSEVPT
jgi:hypothetical protein